MLHVVEVEHVRDRVIRVVFDDGSAGDVDLDGHLDGAVFRALRETGRFAEVRVDPELKTVAWFGGADFAPEFLQRLMVEQASTKLGG